jgi:hypothetical protein
MHAACSSGGGSGGQAAKDALGNDIMQAEWLKTHAKGDHSLSQGLKVCCAGGAPAATMLLMASTAPELLGSAPGGARKFKDGTLPRRRGVCGMYVCTHARTRQALVQAIARHGRLTAG